MEIQSSKGVIHLGKELFWDIPESNISLALERSPEWVIPRVFEYGTLREIEDTLEFYGKEKCIDSLTQAKLRPMARAMAYLFLDIDLPRHEERALFYR